MRGCWEGILCLPPQPRIPLGWLDNPSMPGGDREPTLLG